MPKKDFLRKQMYLCISEMLSLRLNWVWSLVIVLVAPLSMLFFLHILVGNNHDLLLYIVTGNMVMSLVTGTMLSLGQELGVLKQIRGFDYFATLPLRKINIMIAYITRATITTIPSLFVLYGVGKFFLKVPMQLHISIVFVSILAGFSLSAVGAFVGIYSRNAEHASSATQIIQPLVVYLAPVYVNLESMPQIFQIIAHLIPTTYVAKALRLSCQGKWDITSIAILLGFSVVSVVLIEKKMDWRQ
ncbi:MAG: ABC transporter permease [Lachnospiraceae bacterium]